VENNIDNMRLTIIFLILILAIPLENSSVLPTQTINQQEQLLQSQTTFSIVRNWTIRIVVVNYNEELIDESILLQNLPTQRYYQPSDYLIRYNIDYEVFFTNDTYANQLEAVMLANSENGSETGTRLDEALLEYQENHPDEPQRVFYPRPGRAIDGYTVEDWLVENPAVRLPDLGYTLYLVNYSKFDTQDHSLEHWYDYHPVDPDTGRVQDFFRLEWDNALNPDVKFEFPAFGGRYNQFVLDPSADQWYLRWCRIWWGEPPYTADFEHCTKDLEDKVAELNLEETGDRIELNRYLRDYLHDPITYLFAPGHHAPTQYVESGMVKVLVFCMDVEDGISVDSLRWVTNAELQKDHLTELIPFIEWNVSVEFLDFDDYPNWQYTFWSNAGVIDGTTVADGYSMFYDIYDYRRPEYLDDSYDINVFGVIFIKKQMEMIASGRTYTGLGGHEQTVCWKTWERYYLEDGVTPKSGISIIQLHEAMHAIGFMHTWVDNHYVGDFCSSPMAYFSFHNGTSSFDRNWAQASYLDQMEHNVTEYFTTRIDELGPYVREETTNAQDTFYRTLERAQNYYNKMDWLTCYQALQDARVWADRMYFSSIDITPPSILNWTMNPIGDNIEGFEVQADVIDENTGIENVSVHIEVNESVELVYPCNYDGVNWTCNVQPFISESDWRIWVEAWDRGMNHAQTDFILFEVESPPNIWEPLLIAGVVIVSALAVVVFVYRFYFRSRRSS
jgi:hypothetical protein